VYPWCSWHHQGISPLAPRKTCLCSYGDDDGDGVDDDDDDDEDDDDDDYADLDNNDKNDAMLRTHL
jgi:hypothetical protein